MPLCLTFHFFSINLSCDSACPQILTSAFFWGALWIVLLDVVDHCRLDWSSSERNGNISAVLEYASEWFVRMVIEHFPLQWRQWISSIDGPWCSKVDRDTFYDSSVSLSSSLALSQTMTMNRECPQWNQHSLSFLGRKNRVSIADPLRDFMEKMFLSTDW